MISPPTAKIAGQHQPDQDRGDDRPAQHPPELMWPRCSGPEAKLPTAQIAASPKVSG